MKNTQTTRLALFTCLLGVGALATARAGQVTYDFTTDPTQGANAIQVYQTGFADGSGNSVYWKDAGGNPGGFLGITWPLGGSTTIAVFPDIDQGKIVTAFTFECDLRIGSPQQNERPADGFSINFARSTDPVFESHSASDFATGGAVETGTQTGLAICFDTWAGNALPDGADIEGIIVRVDNKTVLRQAMPTRNGECADDTSLQTGPRNLDYWTAANDAGTMPDAAFELASWTNLCWQKLKVEVDDQAKVTVTYKGRVLLDHFQTTFFPSAGGIVLAGRTGGADEHSHFDNLKLTTTASTATDTVKPTDPSNLKATKIGSSQVALSWTASTDDSGRVAYEVERDGVLLGTVSLPSFADKGLKPNTSYTYLIRATDIAGNKSGSISLTVKTVDAAGEFPWTVGIKDGGWPVGDGGGPDASFVQENGSISDLPGSPESEEVSGGADNDYYLAGTYTTVIAGNGDYTPVGPVAVNEEAAERAFAAADNELRYHFNLPTTLKPEDQVAVTFAAINLDGVTEVNTDPRYGVEVYFNSVKVQPEILIRNAQLFTDYTTPAFSLASVNAKTGPGFDNIVSLKGINYNAEGGGNWLGIDYVSLDTATSTAPPPAISEGLVAYWDFDGDLKDSIKDFDGTARGTNALAFVDGKAGFGKSIKLDGTDQYVEITGGNENELEFPGGSMSIAGWFKVDGFDTEWQALIAKGEGSNYRVARRAATGTIAYAGGVGEGADDVPAVNDGNWHHFVAVTDAKTNQFGTALYVDGVLHGVNKTKPVLTANAQHLFIGENPEAKRREFKGELDDIAIWSRVLTAEEVSKLYNSGAGTPVSTFLPPKITDNLVAYWDFEGDLKDSIKDFDGTARGTNALAFVDGKAGFGKSIKLDGTDQYVDITGGNENELEFPGGSMSIAGWFKVDGFDTEWQALIAKGEGSNYRVARRAATGSIAYAGGVGEGADDVPAVNDGNWHHFVAVTDAKTNQFGTALYVDGVLHGVNKTKPVLTANAQHLFIGENPEARRREFKGQLDDIAIWSRVLTAEEVSKLYNSGTGRPLSALLPIYKIGLNFGADQPKSRLAATDLAGVPGVAQANWNSLNGQNGTNTTIVADVGGASQATAVTVVWDSNNTWASTGVGEENNKFPDGADRILMTGYLDTGDPTTSHVTIKGIPASLTGETGYDLYVYALGGVAAGRAGGYRVLDATTQAVLKDYVLGTSNTNPTGYVEIPQNLAAGVHGEGNYLVFRGLTASGITLEATTVKPQGSGSPARAPVNAVQLVPASPVAPSGPVFTSVARVGNDLVLAWSSGTLEESASVNGPYTAVPNATSPATIPITGAQKFLRLK